MAVTLLPGERVEADIRPAWRTGTAGHLVALAFPAAALAAWAVLGSAAWAQGSQGSPWRFWNYLYGNAAAAYAYTLLALALAGLVHWRASGRRWGLVAAGCAAAWVVLVASRVPAEVATALPVALASAFLPAAAAVEVERRTRRVVVTNLRIVGRNRYVRHEDVRDITLRQGPLGRLLDTGTLALVAREGAQSDGKPRLVTHEFRGIHPAGRVREVVELVIRDATSSDYLRERDAVAERKRQALESLQRG